MTLDHIVKERYPTFVDALRDLDDALSMLFLFASLPSTHFSTPPKTIALCQRLCHEFEHYLITSHTLRKSFLSIKGIYYQATIQGQDVLWLVPYKFVQRVTNDVDFRIMGTFVEFYTTLLGFVNYRLYTTAGLIYPPKFSQSSDEEGAELDAFVVQSRDIASGQPKQLNGDDATAQTDTEATARAQAIANSLSTQNNNDTEDAVSEAGSDNDEPPTNALTSALTDFTKQDPTADDLPILSLSSDTQAAQASKLLQPFTFYLSRETPRAPLEFLLKAFGCPRIGWDAVLGAGAFTNDESDQRITHQIVDRPPLPVSNGADAGPEGVAASDGASRRGMRYPNRTYVQPQWVWDSVNACELQRPDLYALGATLPPHLSPFVKPKTGVYDPTKPLEEIDVEEGTRMLESGGDDDEEAEKDVDTVEGVESVKELGDLEGSDGDEEEAEGSEMDDMSDIEEVDEMDEANGLAAQPTTTTTGTQEDNDADFSGFSSDDSEAAYQRDLAAEATGTPSTKRKATSSKPSKDAKNNTKAKTTKADWDLERRKMMMPQKKRRLYEKMAFSNNERDKETERLVEKRRKLEGGEKRRGKGRT